MSDIQFFSDIGRGESQSSGVCAALVCRYMQFAMLFFQNYADVYRFISFAN